MKNSQNKENEKVDFTLEESAEQLYRQFAGIDDTVRIKENSSSQSALMRLLNQQEKLLDYYRLLLSETTCLFAGILENSHFAALAQENEKKIKVFLSSLKKIAQFPEFDGRIFCRLRGQQCASKDIGSEIYDYELSFGNLLVDHHVAQIVARRDKGHGKVLHAKLLEAFKSLSAMHIFNFSLDVGKCKETELKEVESALRSLIRYYSGQNTQDSFIVHDEYDRPSINLTLLAAGSNVKPAALQNLVNKIRPMILGSKPDKGLDCFTTVYDAILASMVNRGEIEKMVIEVNNAQWLMQNLHKDPERAVEAVRASRLVLAKYGNNPRMASEIISSINSEGYKDIKPDVMGKRLTRATDFLQLAEEHINRESLHSEALRNIEEGLDHLPDEMYDSLSVDGKEFSTVNDSGHKTGWSLHEKILSLLSFFTRRSAIKKKVLDLAHRKVEFDDEDYEVIARNFSITRKEAEKLVVLLGDCFDDQGNFRRKFFENNIPQFLQYGIKVFGILWHYLKELSKRNSRVTFLNAIRPLVVELGNPREALRILLADIFDRSAVIRFSDRNGLVLGTVLLRFGQWTELSHIELTPEDVLDSKDGLNREMVDEALNFLEKNHDNLIQKFRRITMLLLKLSAQKELDDDMMRPRFLLYLIRELVIFLSLVGGDSAKSIIHGVVEEFGNPNSSYYKEMSNKENLRHSLQLLQVAARGLRRFNDPQILTILDDVVRQEAAFIDLYDEPDPLNHVQRVMERIQQPD
ncbi:MAG: hypothetical protein KKG47_11755 [Proteobacteria bacterium]|nr:hypothetical protein [Pseudomonadota bacterium]MBU1737794.1 hypothetical protein [Pseudomonadota bacterium]